MAWTATLRDLKHHAGQWDVSVVYTDGVTTVTRGYVFQHLSDDLVREAARSTVQTLERADVAVVTLTPGGTIDLTPPLPQTPPPPDVPLDTFRTRLRQLQRLMRMVELGLILRTDSRIVTLVAAIQTAWDARFMDEV